jgi:type I restriction enzyme M protein
MPPHSGVDPFCPPFNNSDWRGELLNDDKCWVCGGPSAGKANSTWVQRVIHNLAPLELAGFVLTNGSMPINPSSSAITCKTNIHTLNPNR